MKIEITDHRKIFTVQKEFSELFPFLKIEFFGKPHTSSGAPSTKLISHASKTLGDCRTIHEKGTINISPGMTVRELEQIFKDEYGLTIKVSRIFGNGWLDTTETDGWSLEKQSKEGQKSIVVTQTD